MTTTETARAIRRRLDYTSSNTAEILPALRLMFGEMGAYIAHCIDENGYHLVWLGKTREFIEDGEWKHRDRRMDHLPMMVNDIIAWLEGLSHQEKLAICKSVPMEAAYIADPDIDLVGFRIMTARSRDGEDFMVTIIPAWA